MPANWVLGESSLVDGCLLAVSSHGGEREIIPLVALLTKGTNPIHEGPTPMT